MNKQEYLKKYREDHKQEIIEYKKKYYQEHKIELKEEAKQYQKQYRIKHKEEAKKYFRTYKQKRQETDISYKLSNYLRSRIWWALKGNVKSAQTIELIGCSIENLKVHIENQFTDGMTWKNYGAWHVDHIRPCASFDMSKKFEQFKCFNYKNLQPLWATENRIKNDKYSPKQGDLNG